MELILTNDSVQPKAKRVENAANLIISRKFVEEEHSSVIVRETKTKSKERKSIHPVSKVSESDEEYLYTARSNQTPKVNVKVCQHWFKATVDTGATINVVDQETFAKMVKPDLKKTSIKAFAFYAKSPVRFVS